MFVAGSPRDLLNGLAVAIGADMAAVWAFLRLARMLDELLR
jgi:hypothetical protein